MSGVVIEPYRGAKKNGYKGGAIGVGKGIAGLVGRPIKGIADLVLQPTVGLANTPSWIGKKIRRQ